MPERIPQSVALRVPLQAYLSSDHISPATGKTIAITISKNGAAYGNPSAGATNATEIANGSYYVDLSAADTNTNGPLFVRGAAATIDDVVVAFSVAAPDLVPIARAIRGTRNQYYVDPINGDDGNDGAVSTPFQTIAQACTVATAGDEIILQPHSSYSEGVVRVPAYVTLHCPSGIATITSSQLIGSLGCIVSADNYARIRNIRVVPTDAGSGSSACFGFNANASAPQPVSTGVVVENCSCPRASDAYGDGANSDGTYFKHNAATTPWRWTFIDCDLETRYDAHTIISGNANGIAEFYRCRLAARGPSALTGSNPARAVTAAAGITRCFDCFFYADGAEDVNYCVEAQAGGTIELYNCRMRTGASGTNFHIHATSTGIVRHSGCDFDTTLTGGTGTITAATDRYAQEASAQKVLKVVRAMETEPV